PELTRVLHLDRQSPILLEQVLTHEPGVVAGATGREDDLVGLPELADVEVESAEVGGGVRLVQPAAHGGPDGLRLLVNLLEHVVRELAPIRGARAPLA